MNCLKLILEPTRLGPGSWGEHDRGIIPTSNQGRQGCGGGVVVEGRKALSCHLSQGRPLCPGRTFPAQGEARKPVMASVKGSEGKCEDEGIEGSR